MDSNETLIKARNSAYDILLLKPLSKSELKKKLEKKGFNDEIVLKTLEKMEESGYINDENLASMLIRHLSKNKRLGPLRITHYLTSRGIDKKIITHILREWEGNESELPLVKDIIAKRFKGIDLATTSLRNKQRIFSHLKTKGFRMETIHKFLRSEEDLNL